MTSATIFFSRSSNSPRYLVPATSAPMSSATSRLPCSCLGHVAGDDPLGQALDDRRLADARLADQGRVVLGAARQDLDDALDLVLAADQRSELVHARRFGQVDAERVHIRGLGLVSWSGCTCWTLADDLHHLGAHLLEVDAQALQHAGGDALAFADQAEQQVLGADVVVVQAPRLVDRQLDTFLARGVRPISPMTMRLAAADDELDRGAHLGQLDAHVAEHPGGDALALAHQAEQQMLGADVVVVEALRFFLGELSAPCARAR